ncbi:MAG: OmcA/MtrC family decaheme c-type cytochrome [Deltaproteobacteria bacterium]|nr:OmcA/MtrC family decaheme c-type cytochrome [Deltaproteobacteria bacterium]
MASSRVCLFAIAVAACGGDNGLPGEPGANALTQTSDEPPGPNCAHGGIKIEVGLDLDRDGTLSPAEVNAASTTYVCHGAGTNAVVRTRPEDAGANCPFGGARIETGLDTNNNGALDDDEVDANATSYVCNFGPSGALSPSTGIHIAYRSNGVTTAAGAPIAVRFTLRDDRGFPLDLAGVYSINTPLQPRFSLAYFTVDGAGLLSHLTTLTKSASGAAPQGLPTAFNPLGATGNGTLAENGLGAGDYTYTFPAASTPNGALAVAYDPAKLDANHVVWTQVTRQTDLVYQLNANTFSAANEPLYFVPSGAAAPVKREIVTAQACNNCHGEFKAETVTSALFHGGGRVDGTYCAVCHNPGRTTNPLADSASFVHRIHNGAMVADENRWHGIAATYPQDIRNCNACHGGSAQGAQALSKPSTLACKGCHDYVSFTTSAPETCGILGRLARGPDGRPLPCNHVAGPQPDSACAACHGPNAGFATERYHRPVQPPDPNNAWLVAGGNANTNAAFLAASGYVPPGADAITYDVKSVDAVTDGAARRPQITFKLRRNGADVVFQTFVANVTTELMPNFVGSPSVYFAWAMPQDGIAKPSDFNASASGYLKKIWDGTATGTGAGTLTGPDAAGYYTIRLTGVQVPAAATMLTGGLGYTYSLASTPPLVQTNVPGYPWTPNVPADGKAQGGLSVPSPNVWKVATGFAGRRAIVDTAKCNKCHGALGVAPGESFHAGQRNDGPTCSFCHTPNRTSAGWAASSKYAIHAIHAGRKRTVPFTWHAAEAGAGYDEIEFPGTLNTCTTCHVPNTYDFTNASNLAAVAGMELTTAATGKLNSDPLVNSTYFTISPYVVADNVTDYGAGFSFNAATGATTQASGANLVISPMTAACAACHDTRIAIDHMRGNGGAFYATRASLTAPGAPQEQCLLCHGPGKVAAIGIVHQR